MDANDDRLRAVLVGRLESLERAGVMQLPKAERGKLRSIIGSDIDSSASAASDRRAFASGGRKSDGKIKRGENGGDAGGTSFV